MEAFLNNLFTTNEVILIASYAQAFFVLGLSVALQWRKESRLQLARSVPLLAAFGLVQAFVIWSDLVIPSQASLLSPSELAWLRLLQLLMMLLGFTFLLHFGLLLNWNSPWTPRLPWGFAAISAITLIIAYENDVDPSLLRLSFEQIGRPLLVLPGAMLAAWGMRQTAGQIEAMGLPRHIVSWLQVAGISFGAYAILGGILIPLTTTQLEVVNFSLLGLPFAIPRLMSIGLLAWAMIQVLTIFRIEMQRTVAEMARFRALASDRQRIGRELHDGTIQAIYGAGLMLENAMSFMREQPDTAEEMCRRAMSLLNHTISDIRVYIFELSDGEGQLAEALGLLVNEMLQQNGTEIEYRLEGNIPRYPAELQNHLLQIAREALTNAIKHSKGINIVLSLRGDPDALVLTVTDNGRGLPPAGAFRPGGRGVPNLRARAAILKGTLRVANRAGGGVIMELVVPYRSEIKEVSQETTPTGNKQ